jgi:hypothetical protein
MFLDGDEDQLQTVYIYIIQFYTDAINSVVFGTPVPYLTKYPQVQHYAVIIETEQQILKLLYLIISKNHEKISKIS